MAHSSPVLIFATAGQGPGGLAVADFNSDGRLDLVTSKANAVNLLFGTTAALSPGAPIFPSQNVGTSSTPITVTLTNTAATALNISSVSITGNNPGVFSQTNTFGNQVAAGASCTFSVTFTPTVEGTR